MGWLSAMVTNRVPNAVRVFGVDCLDTSVKFPILMGKFILLFTAAAYLCVEVF